MRTADPATLINRQLISADTVEEAQIGHDWWHTPFGWTVVCEQQELWNAPGSIRRGPVGAPPPRDREREH